MAVTTTRLLDNYIDGEWTPARAATDSLDVTRPATGEVLVRYTRKKTVTSRWFSSGQGSGAYFVER
jgi:hypothetical protein